MGDERITSQDQLGDDSLVVNFPPPLDVNFQEHHHIHIHHPFTTPPYQMYPQYIVNNFSSNPPMPPPLQPPPQSHPQSHPQSTTQYAYDGLQLGANPLNMFANYGQVIQQQPPNPLNMPDWFQKIVDRGIDNLPSFKQFDWLSHDALQHHPSVDKVLMESVAQAKDWGYSPARTELQTARKALLLELSSYIIERGSAVATNTRFICQQSAVGAAQFFDDNQLSVNASTPISMALPRYPESLTSLPVSRSPAAVDSSTLWPTTFTATTDVTQPTNDNRAITTMEEPTPGIDPTPDDEDDLAGLEVREEKAGDLQNVNNQIDEEIRPQRKNGMWHCKYEDCNRSFKYQSTATIHAGCHGRPYSCPRPGCDAKFGRKDTMMRHATNDNLHKEETTTSNDSPSSSAASTSVFTPASTTPTSSSNASLLRTAKRVQNPPARNQKAIVRRKAKSNQQPRRIQAMQQQLAGLTDASDSLVGTTGVLPNLSEASDAK